MVEADVLEVAVLDDLECQNDESSLYFLVEGSS